MKSEDEEEDFCPPKPRWKRLVIFLICALALPVVLIGLWFCLALLNPFHAHEHCIKITGFAFENYAANHAHKYPSDPHGFGDAMLMLVKSGCLGEVRFLSGPGDGGEYLKDALKGGTDVPEDRCTRVYVQGLTETNEAGIALLFDRYSSHGGDHCRAPWRSLCREVWLLGGSMTVIGEKDWPEFKSKQIALLVQAGLTKEEAGSYYSLPVR
jgi:hypothetical protein